MGLDSHLESNAMHWDCAIKCDSHHKKHRNNTQLWHECITLHSKECCIWLLTKLKEEDIATLTVKSNTTKYFCMRRFSFVWTKVNGTHATLIIIKFNDLEELGFNEVHLNFLFDHIKSFNQVDVFEWDNNEDANYVDALKCENTNSCIERETFSCNVMKKDSNNKHIKSSEKMKCCYSEMSQESLESFKIFIDGSIRSNAS